MTSTFAHKKATVLGSMESVVADYQRKAALLGVIASENRNPSDLELSDYITANERAYGALAVINIINANSDGEVIDALKKGITEFVIQTFKMSIQRNEFLSQAIDFLEFDES